MSLTHAFRPCVVFRNISHYFIVHIGCIFQHDWLPDKCHIVFSTRFPWKPNHLNRALHFLKSFFTVNSRMNWKWEAGDQWSRHGRHIYLCLTKILVQYPNVSRLSSHSFSSWSWNQIPNFKNARRWWKYTCTLKFKVFFALLPTFSCGVMNISSFVNWLSLRSSRS